MIDRNKNRNIEINTNSYYDLGNDYHVKITCLVYGYDSGYSGSTDCTHGHNTQIFEFDIIDGVPIYTSKIIESDSWERYGTVMQALCKIVSVEISQIAS